MSITKRKSADGKTKYLVRIESPDPVTGKRRRVTVGTFPTKKIAEKEEAKAITERERGTLLEPDRTTVGELLDKYLTMEVPRTVRPENRNNYEVTVRRHLKPALGAVLVRKLTVERVESFYGDLQARGYSSSLITKCHTRLGAALRLAKRWGLIHDVVTESAKLPKVVTRPARVWTPSEVATFLTVAADDGLWPYWLVAVESGARTSELLGTTWQDVDFERGTLRLGAQVVRLLKGTPIVKTDAKTAAGRRTIRLTADTLAELRAYQTRWKRRKLAASEWHNEHDLVFCSATGRPLNASNLRRAFDRLVKAAGVTLISPHEVRKTHITATIAAGGNVKAVAARVGHRDVTTTLGVYTSLVPQMEDELMNIVEAIVTRRKAPSSD